MNDDLTELEKAQAVKIQELMVDNNRMRDSLLAAQQMVAGMVESEAKRCDMNKHWRYTFAGMAMQGILSSDTPDCEGLEHLSIACVNVADALIGVLEKEKG